MKKPKGAMLVAIEQLQEIVDIELFWLGLVGAIVPVDRAKAGRPPVIRPDRRGENRSEQLETDELQELLQRIALC